jgi:hypothetical protein
MLPVTCLPAVLAVGLPGYRVNPVWADEAVRERLGVVADFIVEIRAA